MKLSRKEKIKIARRGITKDEMVLGKSIWDSEFWHIHQESSVRKDNIREQLSWDVPRASTK